MSDKRTVTKFTGKQQAFIDAYFACNFNGVRAARKAGYKGSYGTLAQVASENLKKPELRAAINARFKEMAMGAEEVLARLTDIARADYGDLTDKDGNVDVKLAKRRGLSHLIKEQEFTEKYIPQEGHDDIMIRTAKVRLHDPMRALELIGKYHVLFTEKQEISGPDGGAIEIKPIDYRHSIAALTSGSDSDSAAPGKD